MNNIIELIRTLSKEELHYVYHSSGLENSRHLYRDYFCSYIDDEIALNLVKHGLMTGPQKHQANAWGTNKTAAYYFLTKLGKQVAITIKRAQNSSKSRMVKDER